MRIGTFLRNNLKTDPVDERITIAPGAKRCSAPKTYTAAEEQAAKDLFLAVADLGAHPTLLAPQLSPPLA